MNHQQPADDAAAAQPQQWLQQHLPADLFHDNNKSHTHKHRHKHHHHDTLYLP